MTWQSEMADICETARLLSSCNVAEIEFDNGVFFEVYFAMSSEQRKKGLGWLQHLDLSGMLFCYDYPTVVPFTAKNVLMDLDIAWYNSSGSQLDKRTVKAGDVNPICSPGFFSYVLETPAGSLPDGNIRLRKD